MYTELYIIVLSQLVLKVVLIRLCTFTTMTLSCRLSLRLFLLKRVPFFRLGGIVLASRGGSKIVRRIERGFDTLGVENNRLPRSYEIWYSYGILRLPRD